MYYVQRFVSVSPQLAVSIPTSTSTSPSMPHQAEHLNLAHFCSWEKLIFLLIQAHLKCRITHSLNTFFDIESLSVSLCVRDQWLSFQTRLWHWQSDGGPILQMSGCGDALSGYSSRSERCHGQRHIQHLWDSNDSFSVADTILRERGCLLWAYRNRKKPKP